MQWPKEGQAIQWPKDTEQSIDLALTCNIDIIVTGDFNVNMLRNTSNDKIGNLKNQFSLHQLISDHTYVTEHSSSLLDPILVNNPRTILLSEVGISLLDQVRYHLPVIGVIDQSCKLNNSFKRKVYLHVYDRADFSSYRENSHRLILTTCLHIDSNDTYK